MHKLAFCILLASTITGAMTKDSSSSIGIILLPNKNITCIGLGTPPQTHLCHAFQNGCLVSLLKTQDTEITRTYTPYENGYTCSYSGRILANNLPLSPDDLAIVQKCFYELIAKYGLQDKTPEQIKAACNRTKQ